MPLNEQSALYQQIAKMLEDGILRGIYREEEQVPSTNELARSLHINPATAAKGINELVEQGILYKMPCSTSSLMPLAAVAGLMCRLRASSLVLGTCSSSR